MAPKRPRKKRDATATKKGKNDLIPSQNSEDCPICFLKIKNKSELFPCGHKFCKVCIWKWFHRTFNCPLCRSVASEIKIQVKGTNDDYDDNNNNNTFERHKLSLLYFVQPEYVAIRPGMDLQIYINNILSQQNVCSNYYVIRHLLYYVSNKITISFVPSFTDEVIGERDEFIMKNKVTPSSHVKVSQWLEGELCLLGFRKHVENDIDFHYIVSFFGTVFMNAFPTLNVGDFEPLFYAYKFEDFSRFLLFVERIHNAFVFFMRCKATNWTQFTHSACLKYCLNGVLMNRKAMRVHVSDVFHEAFAFQKRLFHHNFKSFLSIAHTRHLSSKLTLLGIVLEKYGLHNDRIINYPYFNVIGEDIRLPDDDITFNDIISLLDSDIEDEDLNADDNEDEEEGGDQGDLAERLGDFIEEILPQNAATIVISSDEESDGSIEFVATDWNQEMHITHVEYRNDPLVVDLVSSDGEGFMEGEGESHSSSFIQPNDEPCSTSSFLPPPIRPQEVAENNEYVVGPSFFPKRRRRFTTATTTTPGVNGDEDVPLKCSTNLVLSFPPMSNFGIALNYNVSFLSGHEDGEEGDELEG